MAKEIKLVTHTQCDETGAPEFTILNGHHTVEIFNEAFIREGWEADPFPEDYISHEYWVKKSDGRWESSNKNNPLSVPVTVGTWEGPIDLGPDPSLH